MRVVFVGAGNLATRLSLEMRKSGMSIGQVYSHTSEHAKILADELGCGWTVVPEDIVEDADLYVFSLKDAVLQDVIARVKPNNGLWVHTAGSMPISVFEGLTARYGVVEFGITINISSIFHGKRETGRVIRGGFF